MDVIKTIERQVELANEWIGENTTEEVDKPSRKLGRVASSDQPQGERSIFDDIDS